MNNETKFPKIEKNLFRISSNWLIKHHEPAKANKNIIQKIIQDSQLFQIARLIKGFETQLLQIFTMLTQNEIQPMNHTKKNIIKINRIIRVFEYLELQIPLEQFNDYCQFTGLLLYSKDQINFQQLVKISKKAYEMKQQTQELLMKSLNGKVLKPKTPPKKKKQFIIKKAKQFNEVEYCIRKNQPISISFIDELNTKIIQLYDASKKDSQKQINDFIYEAWLLDSVAQSSNQQTNLFSLQKTWYDQFISNSILNTLKPLISKIKQDDQELYLNCPNFIKQIQTQIQQQIQQDEDPSISDDEDQLLLEPLCPKDFHSKILYKNHCFHQHQFSTKIQIQKQVMLPLYSFSKQDQFTDCLKKPKYLEVKPLIDKMNFNGNCEIVYSYGELNTSSSSDDELCDHPLLAQQQIKIQMVQHNYVQPIKKAIKLAQQKISKPRNYSHFSSKQYLNSLQYQQCNMMQFHKWQYAIQDYQTFDIKKPNVEKNPTRVYLEDELHCKEINFELDGKDKCVNKNDALYDQEKSSDSFEFDEFPQELEQPVITYKRKKTEDEEIEKKHISMKYDNGNGIQQLKIFVKNGLVCEMQGIKNDDLIWDIVFKCEKMFKMHEKQCYEIDLQGKYIEGVSIKTRQVDDQILFCCFQLEAQENEEQLSIKDVKSTYQSKSVHTNLQQESINSVQDIQSNIEDFFNIVEINQNWNMVNLDMYIRYSKAMEYAEDIPDIQFRLIDIFAGMRIKLIQINNSKPILEVSQLILVKNVGPISKRLDNNLYPIYLLKKNMKPRSKYEILEETYDNLCLLIWNYNL